MAVVLIGLLGRTTQNYSTNGVVVDSAGKTCVRHFESLAKSVSNESGIL